ncbi:flagellar assembly protein FliH [Salisediminibacterium halotolerans]|nr:flagellar assembly protein FliH [Actinophytocola xinjiangensis]RPE87686.1 flagellar assembly protein FliH [Salisediminibacterium halotolerans]TWG35058.1 flagellar assembly protein FliH [Salisediminibacterium halotolerans]
MILLSRIIKPPYALPKKQAERTIGLKEIKPETAAVFEEEFLSHQPDDNETAASEKERLAAEKETIQQMQQAFEEEKRSWAEEIEEEKQQIAAEAEKRFKEASQSGYDDGYQQGVAMGKEEYREIINEAKQIVDAAKADYNRRLQKAEPDIIKIAAAMAEKVISRTLDEDACSWTELVKQAVTEVREQEEIKIYVHPDWYEFTLNHQQELQEIAVHTGELVIYPDEQLQVGGCVLETPFGLVDASVDKQLKQIRHQLFESLKGGLQDEYK